MDEPTPTQRRSASVVALVKALAEAQAEMEAPKKSKTAKLGTYSYQYADLAAVRDAYRGPLSKRGLVVSHSLTPVDGHVVLTTSLLHTSGEWIASDYPIPSYDKPQEQGSALTYFKRYNVCALLDIVAEDDDDGATAQAAERGRREEPRPLEGDAAAITFIAAELAELTKKPAARIIQEASAFPDKENPGKIVPGFGDPREPKARNNPDWVRRTRVALQKNLDALKQANAEPGVKEAASLLT
jgi:ERF superfamily protein